MGMHDGPGHILHWMHTQHSSIKHFLNSHTLLTHLVNKIDGTEKLFLTKMYSTIENLINWIGLSTLISIHIMVTKYIYSI